MSKKKETVDIITMGCSKNLVDSETLIGLFEANGYHCTHDSDNPKGDIVVINTCGFIQDAKQESINTILEFAQAKDEGRIRKLFVMGCLSERYMKELGEEIPQVDKYYGKFNFRQLISDLKGEETIVCDANRRITTPRHYAYIKISEGCDRHCAYCAIPIITGRHVSRTQDEILEEVRQLVKEGTTEFQIIAQELTYYGVDIDGKRQIAQLIDRMAHIEGVKWIRLHYAYPTQFPMELLDVIRENDNVCKYLDIALQHVSDKMLKRMHRNVTKEETYQLVNTIRDRVPGIHLRTTLMVGFPGESEEDFNELVDFARWARFERMGAFAYSEEEGTYSADHYDDDVDEETKQRRLDKLMRIQQSISGEIEGAKVGTELTVVIDRIEGEYYIGRSEFSSPEVDPEVLIRIDDHPLTIGEYYTVHVDDSDDFDLYATVIQQQ
ncbi:MAG: 30S ribosomal protein S12 methylthiotransferase RimO [Prevotellaceae bacterium]|nr:30S ribosomal protein S12 methylthiotransferase RimO [Prevotella sp.]MCI6558481.1 30S ribosomal protein S12 methylthiotransferase RimO [Prevotella sp.]MDD6843855.1 30S ribosomal protein S12 methylthiotransferase RimO [Prevotellaceae bacterium]MDD6977186.1 30S ribosomal protein S12 methylthiotransferase RimO [Prevotellaceae bacterium]MDY6200311.1 30S ribosomal protein S12 methylthiotransferase RimO [Prevotella sp.]